MSRTLRLCTHAALALAPLVLSQFAFAQAQPAALPPDATLLQVTAHGESQRAPDVATITAGVVTRNAHANAAMRDNATRMAAVIAAIRQAGVAERDVQTSRISLQPQYGESSVSSQAQRITGYEVTNTVNVRLRDVGKVGDVLDALVAQGANQINGPAFAVDHPEAALEEARRDALQKAQARAGLYAQAAGLKVRRIVSLVESGDAGPGPRAMFRESVSSYARTPVATGEETLAIDLSATFELGR